MSDRVATGFVPGLPSVDLSFSTLRGNLRIVVFVGLAYYVGCLLGFVFRFPSSGIAYIWPPNAILLTALYISNRNAWPMILGAALVAHGAAHAGDGVPVLSWLWLFLGNAVQAVLAAAIVLRVCRPSSCGETLRAVTVFVLGAAVAAPAMASLLPAAFYVRMGWATDFWTAWGMRTLTNIVTTITLVPPLVAVFGPDRRLWRGLTVSRTAEFIVILLGLFGADLLAGRLAGPSLAGTPPALYACMPFAMWAAARFGIPGLSTCLLAVAYLTINAPGRPGGPAEALALQAIVSIQLFIGLAASPLMFLSVVREESRQVERTEQALYHSEAKNTAILRAIPDLMFVQSKDHDHRYLDYYARDTRELLTPPETFLGKRMRDVLPPELARSFEELFQKTAATGEPQMMEYSLAIRGEERFFEARATACDNDRLLSIVRDITERKHAEAALQKADQALERMSRASALGELTASIAHEVQQPLNAISANAAACLRSLEDDATGGRELGEALTDIMDDSRRAAQVIRRTRELFSGAAREIAPVDLKLAIVQVLALTRHRAARSGETVRAELDAGELIVLGDRVQLQQVLLNLIVNGLDAMSSSSGPNRAVIVRSWSEEGTVHVTVRDSGQGFDPGDIGRIFQPFYTTKPDGLGIGLAICRSIIQAHGGKLTASLNPTGGATFAFRLPDALSSLSESPVPVRTRTAVENQQEEARE